MNKLAIVAVAAISAASFGVAGAFAQAGGDFATADADHDSKVTLVEAQGQFPTLTQTIFDQADANKDGSLDETEYGTLGALVGNIGGASSSAATDTTSSSTSSSSSGG